MVGQALEAKAWEILHGVADPEIPVISLVDLGVIRHVRAVGEALEIGVSPTYSGCPATEVIRQDIRSAVNGAGIRDVRIVDVLSPAWSSDWITEQGARALQQYGIAPPAPRREADAHLPACPRCNSRQTQRISEFGSTPCKSLYRCTDCLEPFERFKCI